MRRLYLIKRAINKATFYYRWELGWNDVQWDAREVAAFWTRKREAAAVARIHGGQVVTYTEEADRG